MTERLHSSIASLLLYRWVRVLCPLLTLLCQPGLPGASIYKLCHRHLSPTPTAFRFLPTGPPCVLWYAFGRTDPGRSPYRLCVLGRVICGLGSKADESLGLTGQPVQPINGFWVQWETTQNKDYFQSDWLIKSPDINLCPLYTHVYMGMHSDSYIYTHAHMHAQKEKRTQK